MTRTYHRREALPGLRNEGEDVDVTTFVSYPVRFKPEGEPPTDDFLLSKDAWHKLGSPDRIAVTVEAA